MSVSALLAADPQAGYGLGDVDDWNRGGADQRGAEFQAAAVRAAVQHLRAALDRLAATDPDTLEPAALTWAVKETHRLRARLDGVQARLLGSLDRRGAHTVDGKRSTTQWLASELNVNRRAAHRQATLARTLDGRPKLQQAMLQGDITPEHARVVAKATEAAGELGPTEEDALLALSRQQSPESVARAGRQRLLDRDPQRALEQHSRRWARRRVTVDQRHDGMVHLEALLEESGGSAVLAALEAMVHPGAKDHTGQPITVPQQRADALVQIARWALAGDALPRQGGASATGLIVVDLDRALAGGALTDTPAGDQPVVGRPAGGGPVAGGAARLVPEPPADGSATSVGDPPRSLAQLTFGRAIADGVGPITVETARRMLCDAGVTRVVMRGRAEVIDVGRSTATWTVAARRAILARDKRCRGCGAALARCEAHHIHHWEHGGPTDVNNGLALCWTCHHALHEGGVVAHRHADNSVTFTLPDGRSWKDPPP